MSLCCGDDGVLRRQEVHFLPDARVDWIPTHPDPFGFFSSFSILVSFFLNHLSAMS